MEAIANRSKHPTRKVKAIALAIVLLLASCASSPNPKPVYDDVEQTLQSFIEEIEEGRWIPVLSKNVIVEKPKKELANMKQRRLDRLRQNLRTVRAAKGKK